MEMKTITTERTVKEERTVYVAQDETKFFSEAECKKYEESALFAVRSRLNFKRIEAKDDPALRNAVLALDGFLEAGNDGSEYYLWKPTSEEDLKNYLQWAKLVTKGYGTGLLDPKYYGECSFRVTKEKFEAGRPYIVEFCTDSDYVSLINSDVFLEAAKKVFDTILSSDK